MTNYKITTIKIENFKSITQATLDFTDTSLVVLDGPNGFGKTTIFDALELAVSGRISRIVNTAHGNEGYNDVFFSKDFDKDTVIKIAFTNGGHTLVIAKRFDHTKQLRAIDRKPNNWDVFETYILDDIDQTFEQGRQITTHEVSNYLGTIDLNRFYSLFYYIQQEENTFFLKKSGKERIDQITELFDTKPENEEKQKLEKIVSSLRDEKRQKSNELDDKQKLLDTLNNGLAGLDESQVVPIEYFRLIQDSLNLQEWDKEDITIDRETRDRFLKELQLLNDFVIHFDEFQKAQENQIIQLHIMNENLLRNTIITAHFLDRLESFKVIREKERNLIKLRDSFIRHKVGDILSDFPYEQLQKYVDLPLNLMEIRGKIQRLVSLKRNASDLSKIVRDLNDSRVSLLERFKQLNAHTHEHEDACPLCGYRWESYEQLIEKIEAQYETFRQYFDESTEIYTAELESLYDEHLKSVLDWIEDYLKKEENRLDESFFDELIESERNIGLVKAFLEWCELKGYDIRAFINNERKKVLDIESHLDGLRSYLRQQKFQIEPGYTEFDDTTNQFEVLFRNLFEQLPERVRQISPEQIKKKIQYIEYQYYHRGSAARGYLKNDIDKLHLRVELVELSIKKISRIISIYDEKIRDHWLQIMRDIEIPFYIYSGKILQDYQRGMGLFIRENEGGGVKSIKFVCDASSDHDAINYLSSGQLSALVISFTLSLNKVYGNNSLDIVLIDDPVQTMDEINMASFVELLRNEFREKQIILSTHEDEISRYMRYKFQKYGLDTLRFNVKERLYLTPQE